MIILKKIDLFGQALIFGIGILILFAEKDKWIAMSILFNAPIGCWQTLSVIIHLGLRNKLITLKERIGYGCTVIAFFIIQIALTESKTVIADIPITFWYFFLASTSLAIWYFTISFRELKIWKFRHLFNSNKFKIMQNKKIVIAGGSGFIGQAIAEYFGKENEIVILSRQIKGVNNAFNKYKDFSEDRNICYVQWNAKDLGDWTKAIDGADLVINLAGKSVNCRYTQKNKQEIFDSRTNSTKVIGEAIGHATIPPKLWINAASATIYRHATDRPQDELTGEIQNDFSVQVCKLWEQTFFDQRTPFTRKVALRMAIALGAGGVMVPYFNLLKFALGGRQGCGRQMYSWVHVQDVCRMIQWAFENSEIEGIYNCSSPAPVTNNEFMQTLRQVTSHKIGLPAFEWMLKIGAAVIGTETELILKSRWVVPTKAVQAGFKFQYPVLRDALKQIISEVPRKWYHLF